MPRLDRSADAPPREVIVFDNGSQNPSPPRRRIAATRTSASPRGVNAAVAACDVAVRRAGQQRRRARRRLARDRSRRDADEASPPCRRSFAATRRRSTAPASTSATGRFRQIGHGLPIGTPLPAAWGVSATATLYRRELAASSTRASSPTTKTSSSRARLREQGWRFSSSRREGDASRLAIGLAPRRPRALPPHAQPLPRRAQMHRGVGRVGALLAEDLRLLLRGRQLASWDHRAGCVRSRRSHARRRRRPDGRSRHSRHVFRPRAGEDPGGERHDRRPQCVAGRTQPRRRPHRTTGARILQAPSRATDRLRPFRSARARAARAVRRRAVAPAADPSRGGVDAAAVRARARRSAHLCGARAARVLFAAAVARRAVDRSAVRDRHVRGEALRAGTRQHRRVGRGSVGVARSEDRGRRGRPAESRGTPLPAALPRPRAAEPGRRSNGGGKTVFDACSPSGAPYVDANPEWVPYRERLSWLRGGKVAIMLHRPTAEANFRSERRLFDAIAAGVPVVATERGFAAELVEREGLGVVVPPSDVDAVAGAIRRLLTDDEFHARCVSNLERIRPRFAWEVVTRPLVDAVTRWQRQAQ